MEHSTPIDFGRIVGGRPSLDFVNRISGSVAEGGRAGAHERLSPFPMRGRLRLPDEGDP